MRALWSDKPNCSHNVSQKVKRIRRFSDACKTCGAATFVFQQQLATGKYGCTEVRVYPTECSKQLGRDPSKNGSSKSFVLKGGFWGGNTLGFVPSCRPHSLEHACTLYAPTSPPQILILRH